MTVRRRNLFLAAAFLGLATSILGWQTANGQYPLQQSQQHELKSKSIPADDVRAAFLRGRVGLPPELEKLVPGLSEQFKTEFPNVDPKLAEPAVRRMLNDPVLEGFPPELREQIIRKAITDPKYKKQIQDGIENVTSPGARTGPPSSTPSEIVKSVPDLSKAEGVLPKSSSGGPAFNQNVGPGTGVPDPKSASIAPDPSTQFPPTSRPQKFDPPPPPPDAKQPVPSPKSMSTPDMQPKPPDAKANPPADGAFKDPRELAKQTPEEAGKQKARQAAAALWERNVGPLDETPAVKRALFDLVEGSEDLTDPDGNNFWDTLTKETGDSTSFADWIDKSAAGESWKMPSWEFPFFNRKNTDVGSGSPSGDSWWSRRTSSSPSSPRSGSGGGFDIGIPGLEGTWLPVVILAAALLGGLLLWKFLYFRDAKQTTVYDLGGIGPWPVDPRSIATREDLVKAFEYLSVMICGPAARMWTHSTIASALADLATTHSETAMILARLYELARYAPLDEPLIAAEIEESRRLVCRLAGVSYP